MTCLQDCLNDLWANVIQKMDIDVFNHTITFQTKEIEHETIRNHQLRFEQVSSFYFLEGAGKERFRVLETEEDSYLELTSIYYYPEGIGSISIQSETEEWAEQYSSNSNFSLEIWSSILFVEAKRVVINHSVFDVEYPEQ
ncbi:hypothetical protein [Domibacillus indicus]|uniref:YxiG family protein n=1 Tax=Domibacillus indicus TaxID=1437523 RepID=UPI00203EAFD3|nr:hypothetical protein [Domibacillus indicus]